jgi:putative acetyltransferase
VPSKSQFLIRRAELADASAISEVLHQSFVEFRSLYTNGGFAATAISAEQIVSRMREGPVWLAHHEDAILGTAAAVAKDKSIYIRGMAVLPRARGSGVGAQLLQHIETWARHEGYNRLFLSTTPFLDSAIRLYERFGFCRTGPELGDLFGTPIFTMEKLLTR